MEVVLFMESTVLFHAQKTTTEIISWCLFISSRLKKSTYENGIKIVPSRFLSFFGSHINSLLRLESQSHSREVHKPLQTQRRTTSYMHTRFVRYINHRIHNRTGNFIVVLVKTIRAWATMIQQLALCTWIWIFYVRI